MPRRSEACLARTSYTKVRFAFALVRLRLKMEAALSAASLEKKRREQIHRALPQENGGGAASERGAQPELEWQGRVRAPHHTQHGTVHDLRIWPPTRRPCAARGRDRRYPNCFWRSTKLTRGLVLSRSVGVIRRCRLPILATGAFRPESRLDWLLLVRLPWANVWQYARHPTPGRDPCALLCHTRRGRAACGKA